MNRYDDAMQELGAEILGSRRGEQPYHLTEEQIAHAEQQLGVRLPEDYREFVRKYTMFAMRSRIFPVQENDGNIREGDIIQFYGITPDAPSKTFDIVYRYGTMCGMIEDWPEWLLPIGSGEGSRTVGVSIQGENRGSIYLFINSGEADNNPYLVTSSFDEFMELICQ